MKITCDGKDINPQDLVTFEALNDEYRRKGGELIECSSSIATIRYDHQGPFKVTFTDRYNKRWDILIDTKDDNANMVFPCGSQILWYGGVDSPTKTVSDPQTQWAMVNFSYQDKTVRIAFNGYKERATADEEWKVTLERWGKILELVEQGVKITFKVLEKLFG